MSVQDPRGMRPRRGRVDIVSGGVVVPVIPGGSPPSGGGPPQTTETAGTFRYHMALVEIQFDTGWEYFSFEGVGTPSQFYEPYVLSIGSLERESPVWGGNFRVSDTDISFINYEQYFTKKKGGQAPGKFFYNRVVRILYGDSGLASMMVLFTGRIHKWKISESGTFTITVRDSSHDRFNTHIHETLHTTTQDVFPNLPIGTEPRLVPVVYGDCDIPESANLGTYDFGGPIPCYLIDEGTSGRWRYVVTQHVCKSVTNVFRYGKSINTGVIPSHYFSLEESAGDRISQDGSIRLTPVNISPSAAGKVGSATSFTSSLMQFLRIQNPPATLKPISSFTITAWVYLSSKTDSMAIASQYGSTSATRSWILQYTSTNDRFEFYINDANGNQTSVTANTFGSPSLNTWYLVTAWWDSSTNVIYISINNGATDQATTLVSGSFISPGLVNAAFQIGLADPTGSTYWNGLIDEFGWWRAVLSPVQRAAIYNSGSGIDYISLLPYVTSGPEPDIEWTAAITPANDQFNDICWANKLGLFVAISGAISSVGGTGTSVIISDDGANWEAYPSIVGDWRSICWSEELGLLVAVGSGLVSTAYVMTSIDGKTWTQRTAANNVSWNSVCWSPELGKFMAVSDSGTPAQQVMESTDGITWTARTAASLNIAWTGIAWSPQLSLFAAVAYDGAAGRIMTSPTGVTWTLRTAPADLVWNDVCWAAGLSLFVAVAGSGTSSRVMTSPDGINWTLRTSGFDNVWMCVIWASGPGLLVAVGRNGIGNNCMISVDGLSWSTVPTQGDAGFLSVAFAPEIGTFAAVNYDDPVARVMFGSSRSYEIVTATYGGTEMTCLDFFYDPRDASQSTELEITASVQGITSDGTSGGTLLTNPADILEHFLLNYVNCMSTELDSQAFDIAETVTSGYSCSMPIIHKDVPYSDVINKWCRSFLGSFYVNNLGQYAVYIKTSAVPISEGITFHHDTAIVYGTFEVESNDAVATTLQYDWMHLPTRDYFAFHNDLDTGEFSALGNDVIGDQLELFYVRDSATALFVAQSYAELYAEGVQFISFGLSIDNVDLVDLNSIADITHWQGIGLDGYDAAVSRVFQLVMDITPTNVGIRVRALKLKSVQEGFARPWPSGGAMIRPVLPSYQVRPALQVAAS